jgi:SAM-dependent methyltransferase
MFKRSSAPQNALSRSAATPDRIAAHYERHAHAFDAARRLAFVERPWIDRFMITLPKGGRVLDLGCGGGEPVARHLVDAGFAVTGVDSAPTLIALARTRFPRHRWLLADMRTLIPDEAPYGGILAWDSLFHLDHDEQAALIGRMAAWLKPRGRLLFNTGPEHGTAIGEQFGEDLYHASLAPEEYRALFAEHGLIEAAFRPDDPNAGGRSVWLAEKAR